MCLSKATYSVTEAIGSHRITKCLNQSVVPAHLEQEVPPTKFTLLHDFSCDYYMRIQVLCEFPCQKSSQLTWWDFPQGTNSWRAETSSIEYTSPRQSRKNRRHLLDFLKSSAFTTPHFSSGSVQISPCVPFGGGESSQFGVSVSHEFPLKASSLSCGKNPSWQAFPWRDRICVAYDAACGLSHLHHQTPKAKCIDRGETRRHHERDVFFFQTTCSGAGLSSWHQVSQHSANRACLRHGDLKRCTELPFSQSSLGELQGNGGNDNPVLPG